MVEVHLVALARLQTSPLDWESNWQTGGNKFPAEGYTHLWAVPTSLLNEAISPQNRPIVAYFR